MCFVSKVSSSYELTCKGYLPKPEYWAFTCFFINLKMNTGCSKVNDISFGAYSPTNMYVF